ncbi:PepSY domain-containing protein [Sphingobacterium sp. DK4209]|uniref:PepSY domain-containing protein n=1 Tax=Sphingobacterium zhuxiongii TaxID=2662364 RepID=A0A5Q0Q9R3_9SPHI|nr:MULTISPECIES: PepSY-associated TM helix domain-containing protein [unclassified Sphingobacterium]MVZ64561.1 PepSY domain-containing protein [Sphingobacterium sp. DK4209]QGA25889.1 PepSY domain-containing protein [Sphingobacterium sp. dk4302]
MFKTVSLWLHKWMGILSGIVVFILGITGCIYTFHDDLKLICYPQKYILVSPGQAQALSLSELSAIANKSLPDGEKVSRVDLFPAKNRSWIFRAQATDENAFGHWNYYTYSKRVFVNPYTGEVLAIENSKTEFFQLMLQLHMNLLLGKKIGHPLVAYSTVLFVFIMLTGVILWWPKRWKSNKISRSFWPKWSVNWKRLNHDLHNIIGFYSLILGLLIGITGLFFSFPAFKTWAGDQLDKLTSGSTAIEKIEPLNIQWGNNPLDDALSNLLKTYPNSGMMSIRLRKEDAASFDIQIRLEEQKTNKFKWYYFDKKALTLDKVISHDKQTAGERLGSLNFDLHTGNIAGWPTKILAFIISLFCASLPVTGYIIWINKSKKRVKRRI